MESIIIHCDKTAVDTLVEKLDLLPEIKTQSIKKSHLDGGNSEWILYVTTATQLVIPVLNIVAEILKSKNIKRIEMGEHKIDSPSKSDIDRIITASTDEDVKDENAKQSSSTEQ